MSQDNQTENPRCASCGVAERDDVKLKNCAGCHLVRYCGVKCQKEHRSKHKHACKKRAAELRDEILFRQPESRDCPICFLPLSLEVEKSAIQQCCGTVLCIGCSFANQKQSQNCPFCREPAPSSEKEIQKRLKDRAAKNDPDALHEVAAKCGQRGDYQSAFEYFSKAAEQGDAESHYQLAAMYRSGHYVQHDKAKETYHYEQAAIGGHPYSRHKLGRIEWESGRHDRAIKHLIIASKLGYDDSLAMIKQLYGVGLVSKDDFAAALRGHKAAVDATKSPQREEAEALLQKKSGKTKIIYMGSGW